MKKTGIAAILLYGIAALLMGLELSGRIHGGVRLRWLCMLLIAAGAVCSMVANRPQL